jgi:hypothetical protein
VVVRKVFTRHDDGSKTKWEEWQGEDIIAGNLYSVGEIYLKATRQDGGWKLLYRMGSDGIRLPQSINVVYQDQAKMKSGIWEFVDWARTNRMFLIKTHEQYCDSV